MCIVKEEKVLKSTTFRNMRPHCLFLVVVGDFRSFLSFLMRGEKKLVFHPEGWAGAVGRVGL